MKIRPGQVHGPQQSGSTTPTRATDGRFQVLLDHEIRDSVEKQPDARQEKHDEDKHHPYQLINDATRVLDDVITEIETGASPNDKTIETLQSLRNELRNLRHDAHGLDEAGIILSVETERLKSW